MNTASPPAEPSCPTRRVLFGVLLALSSGCVRSGHSDHYLWLEVQQRSVASTSTLSVHANRSAFLTTYGRKRADGSREPGPSFDDQLSEVEMKQLLELLAPARTVLYRADAIPEENQRADDSALTVSVDAQVANTPSAESLRFDFRAGGVLRAETRELLDYLIVLQQRLYDRGVRPPQSAPRAEWARPASF